MYATLDDPTGRCDYARSWLDGVLQGAPKEDRVPLDLDQLELINANVNALPYCADTTRYGMADRWEYIDGEGGDCEDFVIAKLRDLLSVGVERDRLKIGLCRTETGEYHAVLVVTLDGEDYVLDNRYPYPREWELCPYSWDKFYLLGERKWRKAA